MIISWIINMLTLFIGIAIGYYKQNPKELKRLRRKKDLGVVKRPTAEQLRKKGTVLEETEKVMTKTLDKVL